MTAKSLVDVEAAPISAMALVDTKAPAVGVIVDMGRLDDDKVLAVMGIRADPKIFDHPLHKGPVTGLFDSDVKGPPPAAVTPLSKATKNFAKADHRQGE